MKFLRNLCGLGFCGLKLKIGRADVNPTVGSPIPSLASKSPAPLLGSGSPSPFPASGSPSLIPASASLSPCPASESPDLILRCYQPSISPPLVRNRRSPTLDPNPSPTPSPTPSPIPSPTLDPNPSPIPSRSLFPLSPDRNRQSPTPPLRSPSLFQPDEPEIVINPFHPVVPETELESEPEDLYPFANFPLGSFPSDLSKYDLGSSLELSHYPLSPNAPPLGKDDMPPGILGLVFNFPEKVVRTCSKVVHATTPDFFVHSGFPGIRKVEGPATVEFPTGGTLHIGKGGSVYCSCWSDSVEAPDGVSIAVPLGGTAKFYSSHEEFLVLV